MQQPFKAIVISRDEDKNQSVETREIGLDDLMEGDVVVEVDATTINYKDGLAITGKAPVIRRWPMVPGIDCAGTVVSTLIQVTSCFGVCAHGVGNFSLTFKSLRT